ncbi:MAG TPA: hypothetical protein VK906_17945 [Egicoccus sp.]|nr:hypothetical protein [Egicoccus sp.]HSK25073.1 hypothetical protein [Egicoccus sp.]
MGRRPSQALLLVLAAGCSAGGPVTPDAVTATDSGLSIAMPSCNARYSTDVSVGEETVEIRLEEIDPGDPDAECADEVFVEWGSEVGGRRVIVNGETFEVTPRR